MNAHTHRVNRRIRAAAGQMVEMLESRAYLSSGGVTLGSPINTPAAGNNMSPVAVNCADFTGNGKDDVYVANQNDTISVLLSKGDGTFQTPINSYAVSGAAVSLATGEFTSSGHLDIVTGTTGAHSAQGDVSILLGNGNGTFQSAINIPALQSNSAIAVGNFVKGGPLDILSVDSATTVNNVCLTITDGTGHLASQTFFSTPFGDVSSIAVGDFGNGHEDFAVTEQSAESVTVYLGKGNGTFQTPTTYPTGTDTTPASIVAGQFDGSGNLDLVTADSTTGQVSFLANQGDGIFGTAVESSVAGTANGGGPLSVGLGQFVSGSEQDIVCLLSPGGSADATLLLGNGDGTFRTGTTITSSGANAVAAGDLAGNGLSDVVLSSSYQISVLPNTPTAVSGTVYDDKSGGGVKTRKDRGMANITVSLQRVKHRRLVGRATSENTDANGNYEFTGLIAGDNYQISEAPPRGYTITQPSGGVYTINLSADQTLTGENFGDHPSKGRSRVVRFSDQPILSGVQRANSLFSGASGMDGADESLESVWSLAAIVT